MSKKQTQYIFITGGVVSGLGKGIAAASIANLLKKLEYKVALLKCDPYINVDPGTLNPKEHGEVFVTEDGVETDLDLGHYERFTDEPTCKLSTMTTGQIYESVIENERSGNYGGKTVQVVPHVVDEIQERIMKLGEEKDADIVIVEIGGTIGDIESLPFLEAIRQMGMKSMFADDCCYIHLTLVPFLSNSGEVKTKPTQHSVRELRSIGISPDIIMCRTHEPGVLDDGLKIKIAESCGLEPIDVIEAPDVPSIYEVPIKLAENGVPERICEHLELSFRKVDVSDWKGYTRRYYHFPPIPYTDEEMANLKAPEINIALIGKYTECKDAYKSIDEAAQHAAFKAGVGINLLKVDSERLEGGVPDEDEIQKLAVADGVIIPGGFGPRGFEGKVLTATWALKNGIPCLGICYGLHAMMVSMCRNLLGLSGANSTEVDPDTVHPVVTLLDEQRKVNKLGGTMRLGNYDCTLVENSILYDYYRSYNFEERHRHRWEINPEYMKALEKVGVVQEGINLHSRLTEIITVPQHPFFTGVQFHPEFKSRPFKPHPMFEALVLNAMKRANSR